MKNKNNYLILDKFVSDSDFIKVANKLSRPYIPANRYYEITKIGDDMFEFHDVTDESKFTYKQEIAYTLTIPYIYGDDNIQTFAQTINNWHVGDVFVRIENTFGSFDYPVDDSRLIIAHTSQPAQVYTDMAKEAPDYQQVHFEHVIDPFVDKPQIEVTQGIHVTSYHVKWVYDIRHNRLFVEDNHQRYLAHIDPNAKIDFANRKIELKVTMCELNNPRITPYGIEFDDMIGELQSQCDEITFRARFRANAQIRGNNPSHIIEETILAY